MYKREIIVMIKNHILVISVGISKRKTTLFTSPPYTIEKHIQLKNSIFTYLTLIF